MTETYIIGTSEAVEAEYGLTVDGAFVLLVEFNGEVDLAGVFATKAAAKAELEWVEDRSTISYL